MKLFCDLHIHSCLSPCGDNDMTPANILGMGAVKGLQMMAVTDHNAAGNLPTAQKVADAYGILQGRGQVIAGLPGKPEWQNHIHANSVSGHQR